jgi:hypothetical protein
MNGRGSLGADRLSWYDRPAMTENMRQLLKLRDEFHSGLGSIEGLISIGFGKDAAGPYLRVTVDRSSPMPALPATFRNMPVHVERGSRGVVALGSAAEIPAG